MKRALIFAVLIVAAVGAAYWLLSRPDDTQPSSSRRNVVLITIDTLRADRLGRGLTPNIDRLASIGRSYQGVRATVPLTLPSHVSLMTGNIPPVHGVRENGLVFDRKLPTIARIFKEAGYRTGAFVGAYVLNRRFGLDEGFEVYDDAVRRDPARAEVLEAERPAGAVVDAALAWLQAVDVNTPFFLWIHVYDPHAPYEPPAEFRGKGNHPYDGEVAYVDTQVARVITALETSGRFDRTSVAITGDHGESLGEHGEATHGMLLYDAALRVPLIVAGGNLPPGPPCHQDVAPHLLRAAGLESRIPPTMTTGQGECGAYAETRYPRRAGWHALTSLADGRWKVILSSEQELYDVLADPAESTNVASSNPNVVQAMAAAVAKLQPQQDRTAQVAPDAAERLRALGYASGSSSITTDDRGAPNPAKVIDAWGRFEDALGRLQSGRATEAAGVLKDLAAAHPGALVFQSTYAQALREAGDPKGALVVYRAAVAKWPNDPALFHDLAAAAREAGDAAEALRAEQAALALDAGSPMAHNGLGLLHAEAGRLNDAVAAFTRATQGDPTNPSYWANLGNARRDTDDTRGADAAYRKALEQDPEFADALNGLGVMAVQGGRAAEGIPLFERALRADPDLHEARLNLGIAYQETGQREKAAATYREVLKKTPPRHTRERDAAAALLKQLTAGS